MGEEVRCDMYIGLIFRLFLLVLYFSDSGNYDDNSDYRMILD